MSRNETPHHGTCGVHRRNGDTEEVHPAQTWSIFWDCAPARLRARLHVHAGGGPCAGGGGWATSRPSPARAASACLLPAGVHALPGDAHTPRVAGRARAGTERGYGWGSAPMDRTATNARICGIMRNRHPARRPCSRPRRSIIAPPLSCSNGASCFLLGIPGSVYTGPVGQKSLRASAHEDVGHV